MKQRFARLKPTYGQRWQAEAVNSMVKRRIGSALRARSEANQWREMILRAITHNVMIMRSRVFYRAGPNRFRLRSMEPPASRVEPWDSFKIIFIRQLSYSRMECR
jgi:hypothetical protein